MTSWSWVSSRTVRAVISREPGSPGMATSESWTRHVTVAETAPDPAGFPDADPAQLVPGSLVFTPPARPVSLDDFRAWWSWVPGAQWRHPEGPASTLHGLDRHPVTHVAYPDAVAYSDWAGKALPTEAEWEFAARGGLDGATFSWGEEPNDGTRANSWQGRFPYFDRRQDGKWEGAEEHDKQ